MSLLEKGGDNQPEDLDGQDPERRDEEYDSDHEVQPPDDGQDSEEFLSSESSSHYHGVPSTQLVSFARLTINSALMFLRLLWPTRRR